MSRPFSLQPLLELMQTRADDASRALGKLIAAEQDAKARLVMLEQYRSEYADQMRTATLQGLTPLALRNYQDFLGRIDQAINQQRSAVQQSAQQTLSGQENWRQQNQRLKAIDTLSQRHDLRERHRENQQEQKLLDEFTTRRFSSMKPEYND